MKRTTRFLSMLLVVVMLIGILPMSALATETGTELQDTQPTQETTAPVEGTTVPEQTEADTPTEAETEPSVEETEAAPEETVAETEPEVTEEVTEAATEPEATEEVTEPETETEPEATEPEATDPAQDEPVAGDEPGAEDETLPEETEDPDAGIDTAAEEDDGIIYILAGSDFQPTDNSTTTGVNLLNAILDQIPNYAFDGFLFAGDYNYSYDESGCTSGRGAVDSTVTGKYSTITHEVYVQGNHDPDTWAESNCSASGANDPTSGAYGVFVINERDYMWYNDDAATIQSTASKLSAYLTAKANAGYNKPIFVVSHLPLHYSLRTQVGGGDGKYAKYIFDVLQTAGEQGLNVIFLYGHNHSHGWDDPYGGAAVYLQPGDNINIAKEGSTTEYTAEALKFTYMNAGFVSYYRDVNASYGAYTGLTMTVFIIKDGQVEVERYSSAGQVNLKAEGVLNYSHHTGVASCCSSNGYENYAADTSTVWEDVISQGTVVEKATVHNEESTVSVTAEGLTSVEVTQSAVDFSQNTYTVTYAITPMVGEEKYTGQATVALDLPSEFSGAKQSQLTATVDGDSCTILSWENGILTLSVPHFSAVEVTYAVAAASTGTTYERVTSVDALVSGEQYLIFYTGDNRILSLETGNGNASDGREGLLLVNNGLSGMPLDTIENESLSAYEWTFTATGDQWYIGDGTQNAAFYTDSSGRHAIGLRDSGSALTISGSSTFTFSGDYVFNYNGTGDFVNGYDSGPVSFYIYKKVANEVVENNHWYPVVEESTGSVYYELVTNGQISSGGKYLIVSGSSGSPYALTSEAGRTQVTVDNNVISSVDSSAVFTLISSGSGYLIQDSSGTHLFPNATRPNNSWRYSISSEQSTGQAVTFTANGQAFRISRSVTSNSRNTTSYLRYNNNSFSASGSQSGLYLFRQVQDEPEAAEFAMLKGQTSFTYITGQITTAEIRQELAEKLQVYTNATNTGEGTRLTQAEMGEFVYANTSFIDPSKSGTYIVNVTYKGVPIGAVSVVIADKQVTSLVASAMEGTIARGAAEVPGVTLTVTYDDDSTEEVPLRTRYLSGTGLNTNANGTYENLTISYGGQTISGFTLHVENVVGNDFPDYPDPGSVSVNKTATGMDFQNTGLARVELSTSGLPAGKGVDVVIVVDTSSSMNTEVDGQYRIDVLRESLRQMLKQFTEANPTTGVQPDIDVAVISFNGYANRITGATLDGSYRTNSDQSAVFTGPKAGQTISDLFNQGYVLSAADFVNNQDAAFNPDTIADNFTVANLESGTNYDAAMGNAYNLLKSKKDSNPEAREQYVIFLSDGAPFRYNGFNQGTDNNTQYPEWNRWLQGEWADDDALKNDTSIGYGKDYAYFYNGNGTNHPHRIAEAIKGTPGVMYEVVDPLGDENNPAYISEWEGLGAKIYSIGFCLAADKNVTEETEKELIEVISSGAGYAFPDVSSASELDEAFSQIAESISYAAQGAYYEDKMGTYFDLQMDTTVAVSDGSTKEDVDTSITVKSYPVYTAGQVGTTVNNHVVTSDDVGKTYGDGTVIETVTFRMVQGTLRAYSSVKGDTVNILNNGIINAEYFWYNTTSTPSNITLDDGTSYTLLGEAFRWDIGTINEQQYTLSYVVKLTDALNEPGVPAGSYATNEYARLTYVNWLGNTVTQDTVSPEMAWEAAQVSYGFYLVDDAGNPLMANGEKAENFLLAYKVTNPILHESVELNTGDVVKTIDLNTTELLELGYEVFDVDASYTIEIHSGTGGGDWTIGKGDDVTADTTYVTNYASANDYTNLNSAQLSDDVSVDYTNTIVWFAVRWNVGAVKDTVVIDYGLPVDISVLVNDMFGAHAHYELTHVGPVASIPAEGTALSDTVAADFATKIDTAHGTAEIMANEEVRYTPKDMQMSTADEFAYAVNYKGDGTATTGLGYYYGTVTVIPATTIYYEDSFITFTDLNYDGTEAAKGSVWSQVGTTTDATQSEDRPGTYSLSTSDANNIYGFDPTYSNFQQFSLGSAMKAHVVEKQVYATAEFTFTGTGFDIISMTSNTTGTIVAQVSKDGKAVTSKIVDTYYGYTIDENGEWVVDSNAQNALYQVPVLKVSNLDHGTYDVVITISYGDMFNHGQDGKDKADTDNSYDFYLDAVRIYGPADANAEGNDKIQDAYVTDNEGWPTYQELRNILITQNQFSSNANITGAAFIDGSDGHDVTIAEYTSYGPNNEVYLKAGQAVVFRITGAELDNVASVQIGLKSADGKAFNAQLSNVSVGGGTGNTRTVQLTTATDMYYDITALRSATIMISNPASTAQDRGILSITTIKVTYKANPEAQIATLSIDEEAAGWGVMALSLAYEEPDVEVPTEPEVTEPETTVPEETEPEATEPEATVPEETEPETTVPEETEPEATEPEETEPEETEPETFAPTFSFKLNNTSVKVGSTVRVTVTTGEDVESLSVNGNTVTTYWANTRAGTRTWTVSVKAEEVGTMQVRVVAYNANGVASAPMVQMVEVTQKYTNVRNFASDLITGLLSKLF